MALTGCGSFLEGRALMSISDIRRLHSNLLLAAEALNPLLMQDGDCHTPPLEYCLSMSPIPDTHRSIPPPPSHKSHQNPFSNITCSINSVLVAPALHDHKSHLSEAPRPMDGSLGKQTSSSQAANSPSLSMVCDTRAFNSVQWP